MSGGGPLRRWGRGDVDGTEKQEYWLSYSDLLAGLLMVFTLLLLASLYQYEDRVSPMRDVMEERDSVLKQLEKGTTDSLIVVREDGRIRLEGDVLFDFDSDEVRPEGETVLRRFAETFLEDMLGNQTVRDALEAVIIEGHTDATGEYAYNLDLSQRRASAVMAKLLEYAEGESEEDLRLLSTANGRAFAELVCVDGSTDLSGTTDQTLRCGGRDGIDDQASRRIEIRFQLRNEDMLRELIAQFSR